MRFRSLLVPLLFYPRRLLRMHLNSFVPAFISCRGVLSRTLLCAQKMCATPLSTARLAVAYSASHRRFASPRFLGVLDLGALHPERADYREDTRLVVDFFDRSGKETSYRANPDSSPI